MFLNCNCFLGNLCSTHTPQDLLQGSDGSQDVIGSCLMAQQSSNVCENPNNFKFLCNWAKWHLCQAVSTHLSFVRGTAGLEVANILDASTKEMKGAGRKLSKSAFCMSITLVCNPCTHIKAGHGYKHLQPQGLPAPGSLSQPAWSRR